MDEIIIGGEAYPARWDMLSLKEYKAFTKNDALANFDPSTENIISLAFYGIKGAYRLKGEKFEIKADDLAGKMLPKEVKAILTAFAEQCGIVVQKEGEQEEGERKPS